MAGGGPAGLMLGLLLARVAIQVTVLEKHADFLRDFRGDTVHPATLEVLDQLGLADRFHALPHRKVPAIEMVQGGRRMEMADFRLLRVRFPYLAFIPQWEFLNLLAEVGAGLPTFRLLMRSQAHDLVRDGGRVAGVRFRDADGEHEIRAQLTVGADGRNSAIRMAAALPSRAFGAPTDVGLFKISRRADDPDEGLCIRVGGGSVLSLIDRGSYWQASFEITKGTAPSGIEHVREQVAALAPFLADRVSEIHELHRLDVRIDLLRRWHAPGLLCIGDAAHAMSPIGGFGVNLAIQDAVATANLLTVPLLHAQRHGTPIPPTVLAAVKRRRRQPTVAAQTLQRLIQRFGIEPAMRGDRLRQPIAGSRLVRQAMAYMVGVGLRPERITCLPGSADQ
ncbi:FAD-dependent oxidoreductase [Nonomuraea antimicrobica]|uniref:FAD-dependent oxidoreductase n=1 Tax=Nonomuraea antimicrobica TaxID=561173 RepID=UPI0031E55D84